MRLEEEFEGLRLFELFSWKVEKGLLPIGKEM